MGCDIHIALEKRVPGKWVMVNRFVYPERPTQRNYQRFAALAGVRGDGPEPKGIPESVSDSTKLFLEEWEGDAHSHSWLGLREAAGIFLNTEYSASDYAKKYPTDYFFDVEDEEADEYRIIFFFDN